MTGHPSAKRPITVVIGPSSFADEDSTPLHILKEAGVSIIPNPHGRRLSEEETLALLQNADALLAGLEPLTRRVLSAAPRLKVIARVGIGLDNVDLVAARKLGIIISNTPEAPTDAVAEMTVAALLTLSRRLVPANATLHSGEWKKIIGDGLKGRRVLLIGFGRIGRRVSELLRIFGAVILASDPALTDLAAQEAGVRRVLLNEGLAQADVISLHAGGTTPLLSASEFDRMRSGVVILNSARGTLVDESALITALEKGVVSQAWLDVFPEEPYRGPLTQFPQVLLTPHLSTYTRQCRLEMETAAVKNLLNDLASLKKVGHAS
jgi:D-3-phosphoglycerate dehydrogenase / 2-oxoglutarate reductase